jgi:toxin ParE1/3/4
VPERRSRGFEVRLTNTAERDVKAILNRSRKEFGESAAARYQALIKQAVRDIGDDPGRPGSMEQHNIMIDGARTYHLEFSRSRVGGDRVTTPRHFLLYRQRKGLIEIGRVLHDSRDLARHLPDVYRRKTT